MADLKNVAEVKVVADANSTFAANLHEVLKEEHPNNLIFSPFSLSAVVAMAKVGAAGKTATEIENGLSFPADNQVLSKGYGQVLSSFKESNEGYTLAAANRLYSQEGFAIKKQFSDTLKDAFGAESQQLDFANNNAAAAEINGWVEKTTNSKIKDLISPDALNALTRVVLVNGVYFKGLWSKKFDPANTQKAPFYLNETDSVEVDMMFKESKFPYAVLEELDAHAVSLPYKGDRLSMIIYVPQSRTGLSKIEAGLKNLQPSEVLGKMSSSTNVQVSLPRFKIESTMSLVEPLKKLGVLAMFNQQEADFSNIPESEEALHVSAVVQKAFIEVNEEGSEAAAATGLVMTFCSIEIPIECIVDRPFLFQIVDHQTNFVLFKGRCSNPSAS